MKKIMKVFSCVLMVVLMTAMMITPAFAAESTIIYGGHEAGFAFAPGSGYTDTDLFENFKNLWPGDTIVEKVNFTNESDDTHYINLYMKAVPHDASNDLTYDEAYENTDGKDQANVDGQRDETLDSMNDFLSQLSMKVWNGTEVIYEASPDLSAQLTDYVFLGKFHKGEGTELTVQLTVPVELGNEYAARVGEVDWVFMAEQMNYPDKTLTVNKVWKGEAESYPSKVTVILLGNGKQVEQVTLSDKNDWTHTWEGLDGMTDWTVQEVVPNGYINAIKYDGEKVTITNTAALIQTGQLNWPVPVMAVLGLMLIVSGTVLMKKKAHE